MNLINKKIDHTNSISNRDLNQNIFYKDSNFEAQSFGCGYLKYVILKFLKGLKLIKESLGKYENTMFSSDNMICRNRNLSFLRDPFFSIQLNLSKKLMGLDTSVIKGYALFPISLATFSSFFILRPTKITK